MTRKHFWADPYARTLDRAAEGKLFEATAATVAAVAQLLDEDAVPIPRGDAIAIFGVIAAAILCVVLIG